MLASVPAPLSGSSKFSRFGDIDTSAKDVYETSDHEETESQQPDVPPHRDEEEVFGSDDDIEDTRLSPRQAFEMFMGKRYDLRNQDMSDSIGKGGRRARPAAEYEVLEAASRRFESPAQKLYRLRGEVAEFLEELDALQQAETQDDSAHAEAGGGRRRGGAGRLAGELRELQEQLAGVLRDQRKRGLLLAGDPAAPVSAELSSQLSQRLAAQIEALRLEARIARLEKLLGNSDPAAPCLRGSVEEVRRRLALLDPARLDAIQRKLQALGPQLELLAKQKALLGSAAGPSEKKVGELYGALERWDAVSQQLPALVARLHSLRALHESAAHFKATLAALEAEQAGASDALRSQAALLVRLERGLAENAAAASANFAALEARVAALQAKLPSK
eukprot:tig00000093_g3450.t1